MSEKSESQQDQSIAKSCTVCGNAFNPKDRIALYRSNHYHSDCFKCTRCLKSLAEKPFVVSDSDEFDPRSPNIVCNSCFEETSPRCLSCNKIFENNQRTLIVGDDSHYHPECFICAKCKASLEDEIYFTSDDTDNAQMSRIIPPEALRCAACFEEENPGVTAATADFANAECDECHQPFQPGSFVSSYKDHRFHKHCFKCSICTEPIGDSGSFFPHDDGEFWCVKCYQAQGPKCPVCNNPFEPDEEVLDYDGNEYHVACFKCERCSEIIGTSPFYLTDGKICCKQCF